MMKMFRTDIAKQVSVGSSPPILVVDCINQAIRAEYWINQDKEARAQIFKVKKEEKFVKNKKMGNAYNQGQQRNYPQKKNNQGKREYVLCLAITKSVGQQVSDLPAILDAILWRVGSADYEMWNGHRHGKLPRIVPIRARSGLVHDLGTQVTAHVYVVIPLRRWCKSGHHKQYPNRNSSNQLHAVQAQIEGPSIARGRLEAPKPQARIYVYTKGDVEAGTSQVEFAHKLGRGAVKLDQPFRTSFPSGEILLSDYWARRPVVKETKGGKESLDQNLELNQGDSLLWYPDLEQHTIGHNKRDKYNSAYSIGFCCDTCLSMFDGYVMMYDMSSSRLCYEVSNLRALVDARWWSVAGRAVKCGNNSRYAFCPFMRVVTELVSERFPAIRFHSLPVIATIIVSLASRCLVADARLWWMTLGEREMPSRTWAHFRTIVIAYFGPVPDEGAGMPYRDPEIYRDMYDARYLSYAVVWHACLQEPMGHYCRRFQEAMLPHVPQDLANLELLALQTLRDGLPPQIRQFVPAPMPGMTIGNIIDDIMGAEIVAHAMQADAHMDDHQVPVDDAGMGEPLFGAGPVFPEDPIPAVPLQEVPAQEAEVDMGTDDLDPANFIVAPEDQPEDPPVNVADGDDEEEELEEEVEEQQAEPKMEQEHGGWAEEIEDFEDDP
ncbi:hypothetical protein TIFTF001_029055 [Ficus carica]|uniref:Uncharacterized protein n=1 Tax=Ficus carica TaxID=3494 RepID=A0AA88DQV2_FICCA|nr:hypothetical protein TIFTF001_029055 [Ficus carica]